MAHRKQKIAPVLDPRPGAETIDALLAKPDRFALFLDIDGTLVDLADTPDAIKVPSGLPATLKRLSMHLGGALALVTGRSLSYADALFSPYRFPTAGLHGAERRDPSGVTAGVMNAPEFQHLKQALSLEADQWPGVILEDKGGAVAVHYRLAPDHETVVEKAMTRYLSKAGAGFVLQKGKFVSELRPAATDKGDVLNAFMKQGAFRGRIPIAVGDDLTDEAMFKAVNQSNGYSFRIAETDEDTCARATIPSPVVLREILLSASNYKEG